MRFHERKQSVSESRIIKRMGRRRKEQPGWAVTNEWEKTVMIIYLVRHGETDWNRAGRLQGQTDIELNEKGREQAAKLREKLSGVVLDAAFSSSLTRAKQTRRIILDGRNVPAWDEPLLKEMNFGQWEGEMLREIRADEGHPLHDLFEQPGRYAAPRTAESFEDLYRRTWGFMNETLCPLETKYGNVLIVAHGGSGRSILNPLADVPVARFWEKPMGNCAVARIALENGEFRLLEYDSGITPSSKKSGISMQKGCQWHAFGILGEEE